jgi:hypothetical protein
MMYTLVMTKAQSALEKIGPKDTKVADEVFLITALLHRENPDREDFTISEIVDRAAQENISGALRPGVRVHASLHCVANKPPNPGRYRMLYATGERTRRLLHSTDQVHQERTGKTWPDPKDVPSKYVELIEWAKNRYGKGSPRRTPWLEGILKMRGMGRELWRGEDPDQYVRNLRQNWE